MIATKILRTFAALVLLGLTGVSHADPFACLPSNIGGGTGTPFHREDTPQGNWWAWNCPVKTNGKITGYSPQTIVILKDVKFDAPSAAGELSTILSSSNPLGSANAVQAKFTVKPTAAQQPMFDSLQATAIVWARANAPKVTQ